MYKKDFPIFRDNPKLVYLDSAATSQKPKIVIDAVTDYLTHHNSNIHRGLYRIAEISEELYHQSKHAYAKLIGATAEEIIYTYNATYACNMLVQSLVHGQKLQKSDRILLGIWDHHANIVPWQIASQQIGFEIEFLNMDENYDIDWDDFDKKYTTNTKVVALGAISNVTGTIFDIQNIKKKIRPETLLVVDGSQLVGKKTCNVQKLGCDVLYATAHKMMALTGLGMLYMKKDLIKELDPTRGGGGMIEDVTTKGYSFTFGTEKWEPGTPNVVGAVSLGKAIEYIQSIGLATIEMHDDDLVQYALEQFKKRNDKITLYGKKTHEKRVGIFSFSLKHESNNIKIAEYMADSDIAIRCGGHCTHPLWQSIGQNGSCRMSLYIYNTKEDIDKLFYKLDQI